MDEKSIQDELRDIIGHYDTPGHNDELTVAIMTSSLVRRIREEAVKQFADELTRKGVYSFNIHDIRKYAEGD